MQRLTLVLLATLSGCSGASPSDDSCESADDCAPGFTCQTGTCVELCIDDRDCEKDEACDDGICGQVNAPACMADVQCFEPHQCEDIAGAQCWGGTCLYRDIADGTPCNATGGTQLDGLCASGSCVDPGEFQCSTNAVCAHGTCIGGTCAEISSLHGPCDVAPSDDADCQVGLACVAGTCLTLDHGACTDNLECVNTCIGGTCEPLGDDTHPCDDNDDADCGPGFVCEATACTAGTLCSNGNTDCAPPDESCISGVCKNRGATCDAGDDADCWDSQQCLSGVCLLNDGEACSQNSECVTVCIAAACDDLAATGELCDANDNADCSASFAHTCTEVGDSWECRRRDGQACAADDECVSVHCPVATCEASPLCVDETECSDVTPRCRLALPGASERTCNPHAVLDEPCDDDNDCAAALRCDTRGAVPLCKLDTGASCASDVECFDDCICGDNECQINSRICSAASCTTCRYSNDNGATCTSLLAAGSACDSDATPDTVEFCSSGGSCLADVGGDCAGDGDCFLGHCECTDADCSEPRVCAASDCGACTFTNDGGQSCNDDISAGTDCDTNKKCDGSGSCLWDVLMPCSATESCFTGFCRLDADGSGQFCAANATNCVYDDGTVSEYTSGQWAPSVLCSGDRRPHCEDGSWLARCSTVCSAGCSFGITDYQDYCHPALEREIWRREFACNSSTCDWNSTPTVDALYEMCSDVPDEVCTDFMDPDFVFCDLRGCECWLSEVQFEACGVFSTANCTGPNTCECTPF